MQDYNIKVADFDLTKDIYTKEYYRGNKHDTIPFKWMAPKSITDLYFDEKTDVVSVCKFVLFYNVPFNSGSCLESLEGC